MTLKITKPAFSTLAGLRVKQTREFKQLMAVLLKLAKNPNTGEAQKISGYPYNYLEVGEYRVVYDIIESDGSKALRVILVGRKGDAEIYGSQRRLAFPGGENLPRGPEAPLPPAYFSPSS